MANKAAHRLNPMAAADAALASNLAIVATAGGVLESSRFDVLMGALQRLQYVRVVTDPRYGARGDGTTDDSAAIQGAIDDTEAAGGGIVLLPPLNFGIASGLTINASAVLLQGMGTFYNADVGSLNTGTRLSWIGSAGGTMLTVEPIQGASAQALKGVGVERLSLRGSNSAAVGLLLKSVQGSRFADLFLQDCTSVAWDNSVVTTLGENRGITRCIFERINIRQVLASSGIGMRADGDTTANFSNNDVTGLSMVHANGVGVQLKNTDSNRFYSVNVNRTGGGTGIGVELHGSTVAENHCRANEFLWLSAGAGGLTSKAGSGSSAEENVVRNYSTENGEPLPTIEAGSSFFYTTSTQPHHGIHVRVANAVTWTNMGAGDSELAGSALYRTKLDLTTYSQARLIVHTGVAGASGADIRPQYSINNGSSFAGSLNGSSGPEVAIDGSTGVKDSGWFNITSAARINSCVIRLVGKDGDGVADPQFSAELLFR